jgi:hypothetical protein
MPTKSWEDCVPEHELRGIPMRPYEPPGGYLEPAPEPTTYDSPLGKHVGEIEHTLFMLNAMPPSRMLAVAITQLETGLLWLKAAENETRHKP